MFKVSRDIFKQVVAQGRRANSPRLVLRYLKLENLKDVGFAFIVSKSVSKKATARNLLKRRGRYIVTSCRGGVTPGWLGIFFVKPGAEKLTFSQFKEEIVFLLKKAKIL